MKKLTIKYVLTIILVVLCVFGVVACDTKQVTMTELSVTMDTNYRVYLFDDLDKTQFTATAKYSDGTEEKIQTSELQFGEFDTSMSGEQNLTITYKGKTTILKINVDASRVYKITGNQPTFTQKGTSTYWKVKVGQSGSYKYFSDENLKNEITEGSWVIDPYVAKSAEITTIPTATSSGFVTITTTTDEKLKIYIPQLEDDAGCNYTKVSNASWTKADHYAYKLDINKLQDTWWPYHNSPKDEYKIHEDDVEKIKAVLEPLEIPTTTDAPALSTKFVIDKIGIVSASPYSRVVVQGKLLYGKLEKIYSYYYLYTHGTSEPFVEMISFASIEPVAGTTNEYKMTTDLFTTSDPMKLTTEGSITCGKNTGTTPAGIKIQPGDEIISSQRQKINLSLVTLNTEKQIAKGDILNINGFTCKVLKINDLTNNTELDIVTNINGVTINLEIEIFNNLEETKKIEDNQIFRSKTLLDISTDGSSAAIATGKVTSVISKIKADIKVEGTDELTEGYIIENLIPGETTVSDTTSLENLNKIGEGKILSLPSTKNADDIYKDVILEINTSSTKDALTEEDYFVSQECIDYLNACLAEGKTIKVYNADKTVKYTLTITAYNFD